MDNIFFTDAQLDTIRAIVRDELAPQTINEAAASAPAYEPITVHFRDGTVATYELTGAAHALLIERWRNDAVGALSLAARRRVGRDYEPCMLCVRLADVLYCG